MFLNSRFIFGVFFLIVSLLIVFFVLKNIFTIAQEKKKRFDMKLPDLDEDEGSVFNIKKNNHKIVNIDENKLNYNTNPNKTVTHDFLKNLDDDNDTNVTPLNKMPEFDDLMDEDSDFPQFKISKL